METIRIKNGSEKPLLFSHFTVGSGNATVALVDDGENLHFGVSLCAPQDMFCRTRGRKLAKKRLYIHLQRYANGLHNSKQAGTISERKKRSTADLFINCRKALICVLTGSDRPKWVPDFSHADILTDTIQFRTKRKSRNNRAG